jgi:lipopolysaccharide transport system ATP-binding protein
MSSDLTTLPGTDVEAVRPVIAASGLGKRYEIYSKPHHRLLRELLPGKARHREFWALRDVDLKVYPGETVGVIGRNGAGKSTLLQLISGIIEPTTGTVSVQGRVAALLELGAGFNPEFTGRENVYLKGSLLGMTRAQIAARFGDILAFSEIGDYIDQPVKTYSSGMFVRLAFAVSVFSEPDVLIVDEALAVGDMYFQRKCQQRIKELQAAGCTLLLVTHSVDSIARLCDRGVILEAGRKCFDGPVREAVAAYMRLLFGAQGHRAGADDVVDAETSDSVHAHGVVARLLAGGTRDLLESRPGYNRGEVRVGNGEATVADFAFGGVIGRAPVAHTGEKVLLHARYHFARASHRLMFGLQVRTHDHQIVYSTNTFYQEGVLRSQQSGDTVVVSFAFDCHLLPGQYYLSLGVSEFDDRHEEVIALDRRVDAIVLTVLGDPLLAQGHAALNARIALESEA